METAKTTQPAAVNALTPRVPARFTSRPFHATQDQARDDIKSAWQRPNKTGLPDRLKTGIEDLSGYSLEDVNVHYNSDKPAQLQAYAYTQGTAIHLASGQERHLAHEAWHVVQQKQGRVVGTSQLKGKGLNDSAELEHEADVMGAKAEQTLTTSRQDTPPVRQGMAPTVVIQRKSMDLVKQELKNKASLANFSIQFIPKHIGLTGTNTNVDAARVHATRANPPQTNTVVANAKTFKNALAEGNWAVRADGESWAVTTNNPVALKSTRKKPGEFTAPPNPPVATVQANQPDKFTVEPGQGITSITGVSANELSAAVAEVGNYPKSSASSDKKRRYRERLIGHVQNQRTALHSSQTAAWVQANFNRVGATNLNVGNAGTVDQINAIPGQTANVTVWIGINTGDIFHLDGYA